MTIRNRELSQFGSFIYIENNSKDIGITTEATPYVGIGTTNAEAKLHVVGKVILDGNVDITGILSASSLESDTLNNIWTPISGGDDVYRPVGNVGIGTSTNLYKLSVNGQIESQAPQGTSPFVVSSSTQVSNLNSQYIGGKSAPSGNIVGTNDVQTLTNKTITFTDNTITGTLSQFNSSLTDGDFATIAGTQTLTNKTLTTPIISGIRPSAGQLQTIPSGTGTLISTNSVGIITNTNLQNSTISGISLGSDLANLSAGSYISYNSGTAYNGSITKIISVAATPLNIGNTVVARDASGSFTAGTITATDFNSTSDLNLKENIKTVENSLDIISNLRGVSFNWKDNGKPSYGVIAQELEKVLPELVSDGDPKTVNYSGIVGVLIEAVKELSNEIEELKKNK